MLERRLELFALFRVLLPTTMGKAWKKERRKSKRTKASAKKKKKKIRKKTTSRALRISRLQEDEENQLLYAIEKVVKIYGAAVASSIFIGVLVYLYALLPWTKWDSKDGIPRYNVPLFVSLEEWSFWL